MRLFVAVFPPPMVRETAHAAGEALRRAGPARASVSWVRSENLHYTMRFLGEVGEDGARRISVAAVEAAAAVAAFDAQLGALGAFPNPARARVLWIGLRAGAEALTALAQALDRALKVRGFGAPDHPFSPHLTLGRVREPGSAWGEALGLAAAPEGPEASFRVDRLSVVESQLSPGGSIYTVRLGAPLSGLVPPAAR
jgi:2'-5' RNA ligase